MTFRSTLPRDRNSPSDLPFTSLSWPASVRLRKASFAERITPWTSVKTIASGPLAINMRKGPGQIGGHGFRGFRRIDPAQKHLVARGTEHDGFQRDLVAGPARLRGHLAQSLVAGGKNQTFDEFAAAPPVEFLGERAARQNVGIVAKQPPRGGVEVEDPPAGHFNQHEGVPGRLHHHTIARLVIPVGLVILFERQLRLDEAMLQLGDRPQVASEHKDDVGIARLVDRVADREFPIRVVIMVDLDRVGLGLAAFAIGLQLRFELLSGCHRP